MKHAFSTGQLYARTLDALPTKHPRIPVQTFHAGNGEALQAVRCDSAADDGSSGAVTLCCAYPVKGDFEEST